MVKVIQPKHFLVPIALFLLALFFVYVYYSAIKSKENIYSIIENDMIAEYHELFDNFNNYLINKQNIHNKSDLFLLFKDKQNRDATEELLSLSSKNVKYLYILQKDTKGRFRFLLDASKTDKARFYQKFDVEDKAYEEIYKTKKPHVIHQAHINSLYLTYLYPLAVDGKIIGIANIDIDTSFKKEIAKLITPYELLFQAIVVFIVLIVVLIIFQFFYYYKSRHKLFSDPLTKLFNRHYLKEIVEYLNLNNYAIAMLDLDKFKIINDVYGHDAGDYVLKESAKIFKNSIRDSDIMIRYGGEEFLLLIYTRHKKANNAIDVCERIRTNIEDFEFVYDEQTIDVTISIGLNLSPVESKTIDNAIKVADQKLYIAKQNGRNMIVTTLSHTSKSKLIPEKKGVDFVKSAIFDNRVLCFYQPIYDPKNSQIVKYEALVRIKEKDGKIVAPFFFMPNIAHTNIQYKITKLIISMVLDKFENEKLGVSINLNYSDFINKDILNLIEERLTQNKELASRITFEILESDEIENIELLQTKVQKLHALGCKISIDDFGSGYSNFKTVLDIEADYLKIDGSLVKNIANSTKDYKVVKNIINFAKDANMTTIAEFVHSKEVYDKLVELDVDYMQGFFIAEPKPDLQTKALFDE